MTALSVTLTKSGPDLTPLVDQVDQALERAILEGLHQTEREIINALPGDSLARGIRIEPPVRQGDRILGIVGTSTPHAPFVEYGTRPHWAPFAPLVTWVRAKLGLPEEEAEAVAAKIRFAIARRGTKPNPVWATTIARLEPQYRTLLEHWLGTLGTAGGGGVS